MAINKKVIIASLLLLALGGITVWIFFPVETDKEVFVAEPEWGCNIRQEERIVRGNSLEGLIESGKTIRVLFGYYDCHEIEREDMVLYSYAGNEEPLLKIIKGIGGDSLELTEAENGWNILINGEVLQNSKGEPYFLDERRHRMLSLYESDYYGLIPEDAYLIMGNLATGSTDSTRYGLIHIADILGKAELPRLE